MKVDTENSAGIMNGNELLRRLRWLIFYAWSIPPVFGLGFILLIGVLQYPQIIGILTTPLEPAYIIVWLAFSVWYLPRQLQPLADWLDGKPESSAKRAQRAVRRFPLVFWITFLIYLVVAPASVIVAAEIESSSGELNLLLADLVAQKPSRRPVVLGGNRQATRQVPEPGNHDE